jgi:CheY-like chemotaxis protein
MRRLAPMGRVYQDVYVGFAGVIPHAKCPDILPTHALHPQRGRLAAAPRVVWGAFVSRGCCPCESRRDGTCFPCGMFLHCASHAAYLDVNAKRAWQRMPIPRSPWVKSFSLGTIRRLANTGNGRGSILNGLGGTSRERPPFGSGFPTSAPRCDGVKTPGFGPIGIQCCELVRGGLMSVRAGFRVDHQSPTVVVADASRIGCQLLADMIRSHNDFRVVGAATTRAEVISDICKLHPDIAVISARLQDGALTGLQVLRELRPLQTSPRVIMLLDDDQSELVIDSFRNGARGIFCRTEMPPQLRKGIHCVHTGQIWVNNPS